MAQISSDELRQVIERVTAEVAQETKGNEVKTFGVADLRSHLSDLAKVGGAQAWTISYSTSSASIEKAGNIAKG